MRYGALDNNDQLSPVIGSPDGQLPIGSTGCAALSAGISEPDDHNGSMIIKKRDDRYDVLLQLLPLRVLPVRLTTCTGIPERQPGSIVVTARDAFLDEHHSFGSIVHIWVDRVFGFE